MPLTGRTMPALAGALLLACADSRDRVAPGGASCRPELAAQWSASGPQYTLGVVGPELDGQPALVAGSFDIVALDRSSKRVQILYGHGDGSFDAPVFHDVAATPAGVAVADLDRDRRLDLVIPTNAEMAVVLLGAPGGGFRPPSTYATRPGDDASIAVSDLDGDGKLDVAVAYLSPSNPCPRPPCHCLPYFASGIAVLPGVGDGTFGPTRTIPTPLGPFGLVATDLGSGPGRDLVMSHEGLYCESGERPVVSVWHDGLASPTPVLTSPEHVSRPAIVDLNRDGLLDVAVRVNCELVALLANGAGGLVRTDLGAAISPQQADPPTCHGASSGDLAAGDLDGDGHADLAATGVGANGAAGLSTFVATCAR